MLLLILGALPRISKCKRSKSGVDIFSGRAVSKHVVFEMLRWAPAYNGKVGEKGVEKIWNDRPF